MAESIAEVHERRMHEKAALEAAAAEQPEEAGSSENRLSAELRSALQAAEERARTAEIDLEQAMRTLMCCVEILRPLINCVSKRKKS